MQHRACRNRLSVQHRQPLLQPADRRRRRRWSYAGVRPLLEDESADPAAVTRDYVLELDVTRRRSCPYSAARSRPTGASPKKPSTSSPRARLPRRGVDPRGAAAGRRSAGGKLRGVSARHRAPLPVAAGVAARTLRARLRHAYSSCARRRDRTHRLGCGILPGLYEREIEYLCREEWAQSAEDILWRRTKLGLHTPPASARRLDAWLARR